MAFGLRAIFLPSDPSELCDKLKLLLQERQAGTNSNINKGEIVAILDKLLEYRWISKKQHKQLLIKCNLIHKTTYNRIITQTNVCIHKYLHSYNCMYTEK